jgi:hypothetical protein
MFSMDYNKILDSTYKWVSFEGVVWYVVFFLITVSILSVVPMMLRQGIFFDEPSLPVVQVLYAFNILVLFVGFFSLVEYILKANNFKTIKVTPEKLLDSLFLIILSLWYIFVWNIKREHRIIQLLVLFVYSFSLFSLFYFSGTFVELGVIVASIVFGIIYLGFVIQNCIRLSFGYFIFYNRDMKIKDSLLESWKITEGKVFGILWAFIIGEVAVLVYGTIIIFIVASLVGAIISPNFIQPVTYKIAMIVGGLIAAAPVLIAEQAFIAETYSQVELKHAIKNKVNKILVRRTLKTKPVKPAKSKKAAKKKPVKKVVKKKTTKKKAVKKKAAKKVSKKRK